MMTRLIPAARIGTALFVLAATACSPRVEPAGPALSAPRLVNDAMIAADGARLPVRRWLPAGRSPRAVVVALHGFNDYSQAFAEPAPHLAGKGIAVYAYDQRGFGAAPHPGIWAGSESMIADARAMVSLVRAAHPRIPVYLMGVSMGGAVAALASDSPGLRGTILVAPAVWGRRHMGFFPRASLWLMSHTMPWFPLTGEGLNVKPSDNIPMLIRLGRDPLVIKESRVDAVHGLVGLMDKAFPAILAIKGPAFVLYGRKEEVLPMEPVRGLLQRMPRRPLLRTAVYEKGYHMLLRDLGARLVLDDIVAWIGNSRAPLPSGADRAVAGFIAKGDSD